jgi:hypothetical protein
VVDSFWYGVIGSLAIALSLSEDTERVNKSSFVLLRSKCRLKSSVSWGLRMIASYHKLVILAKMGLQRVLMYQLLLARKVRKVHFGTLDAFELRKLAGEVVRSACI